MNKLSVEAIVGVFLVAGFLCFGWLSVKLGDIRLFDDNSYTVEARFTSASGLKEGASIEIAGVKIGRVGNISLDGTYYEAVVELEINNGVELQSDSIASIRTAGIIGDKFVKISPGAEDDILQNGDRIEETESAINMEELISKYIFESGP